MSEPMPETWLPVVGYEQNYKVSDEGHVWSMPRATTRGGLMKLVPDGRGYLQVGLTLNGKQKNRMVHQLVAEAFLGPRPDGMEVRHLDGDPSNNAATNLQWSTHKENMADVVKHGTQRNSLKTHCPQDHEYTPENTIINGRGARTCRTCARERGLANYHLRRAAGAPATPPAKSPEQAQRRREQAAARQRAYRQRNNQKPAPDQGALF